MSSPQTQPRPQMTPAQFALWVLTVIMGSAACAGLGYAVYHWRFISALFRALFVDQFHIWSSAFVVFVAGLLVVSYIRRRYE